MRLNCIYPDLMYAPMVYGLVTRPNASVLNVEATSWDVDHAVRLRRVDPVLDSH
jgi:hypothetical protein